MRRNGVSVLIWCLIFALIMCACSGQTDAEVKGNDEEKTNAKSEFDIQMDIVSREEMFVQYNLSVEAIDILKRQTNEAEKTDYVWVELVASNDEFTFSAEYFLIYVLYNEGWLLEECDRKDSEYIAKFQPDYQIAIPKIEKEFVSYEYVSTQVITDNIVEFRFAAVEEVSEYLSVEYQVSVSAGFSPYSGWSVNDPKKEEGTYIWDIEGQWEYSDENVKINLDILSYDVEQDILVIKYFWKTENYSMSCDEYVYYPLKDWPHSGNYDYLKVNRETASVENGFAVNNLIHTSLYVAGDTYKLHANEEGCGILFWFYDGNIPYNIWLNKVK